MRFTDILRTAFMNLWRRKLRAVLTVLGMVIGVSSIVVMMSLGIGIKKSTMDRNPQLHRGKLCQHGQPYKYYRQPLEL